MNEQIRKIALLLSAMMVATLGVNNLTEDLPKNPDGSEFKIRSLDQPMYITIHHTATKGQSLKQIAQGHIERGFPGIGYFAAINWEGQMYQLNDIDQISWHDSGENLRSIGIVLVGNFQERDLPDKAVESLEVLIDFLEDHLNIVGVRGHRDTSATLCPGDYAYAKIKHLFYDKS